MSIVLDSKKKSDTINIVGKKESNFINGVDHPKPILIIY